MNTKHLIWKISDLRENVTKIEFPEFQREPTVWRLDKKERLIDSILREFDISSIYFHKRKDGAFDCIDGRQRINAIYSYIGINGSDPDHNNFNLRMQNEIYDDLEIFKEVDGKRYERLPEDWKAKFDNYKLNIVLVSDLREDEEMNLLFLRLQIASVLNAGEKLHAMTGEMRDFIFDDLVKSEFFNKIAIPERRFARQQVAAQIVLNVFGRKLEGTFKRSRFTDLQEFLKQYSEFSIDDKMIIKEIKENVDIINKNFNRNLKFIKNRALTVSVYLFASDLIKVNKESEISIFADFFKKFLRTLKWQIPLGPKIDPAYYDILSFQTNISQAAGERGAIEKRHSSLHDYYNYYKENNGKIKGDVEYKKNTRLEPETQRAKIRI